jgi:hypothetical protein
MPEALNPEKVSTKVIFPNIERLNYYSKNRL